MEIRKAIPEDLPTVWALFKAGVAALQSLGIDQWDALYPTEAVIKKDIEDGCMYLGVLAGSIVSAAVVNCECDAEYANGCWQFDEGFAVIHRLCVHPAYQNQKLGQTTMLLLEDMLKTAGYTSVRLDAFTKNPAALQLYTRLGYRKTGEATWRKGLFYLFEKEL